MMDLLARRATGGDLYLNLAMNHLANHEWGEARTAVLRGLAKGNLSDEPSARQLLARISDALGLQDSATREE